MRNEFPESDWKAFRELREVALERFCKRVLDEVPQYCAGAERSHHERYLNLFGWLAECDSELARTFDDPRRSQMLSQLAAIVANGLLEAEELARFTLQTRERVELRAKQSYR